MNLRCLLPPEDGDANKDDDEDHHEDDEDHTSSSVWGLSLSISAVVGLAVAILSV